MRFSCQGPSLVVHTPAKLNLFLEILGRRPDGYHELETLMVSIGLYDTLLFTGSDSQQTRLRCHQAMPGERPFANLDGPDNLVVCAAELLRQQTGCLRGVTIDLFKRIPLQAGLGGGSSDAAATLVGLNRFWDLGLSRDQLHTLAAQLGSDVNFFLDSPLAATCRGRGEQITPIEHPQRLHVVVVCPRTGLSTAEVFRNWKPSDQAPRSLSRVATALSEGRIPTSAEMLFNTLEATAGELSGDVADALCRLRRSAVLPVLMSGSGSSCFAVCRTARQARTVAARLRRQGGSRVYALSMGI